MAQSANTPYNNLDSFLGEYGRVTAEEPEDRVGAMWSVILGSTFPVARYAMEMQSRNPGGYTDFTMSEWTRTPDGQLLRRPFLVVETKKASRRGRPRWEDGERQLKRYFDGYAQTAATGQTGVARLYGAVAIGTAVKFYTYNWRLGRVSPLFIQREGYEVRDGAELVIERLRHIENRH